MAGNSCFTYENIKDFVENLGYELINKEYKNNHQKLILKDNIGYYYFIILTSLQRGSIPDKFNKSNLYTIQNIKLWCKLNNKPFELISDTYESNSKNLKWQCLKDNCGEEFEMDWGHIIRGRSCQYCAGMQVCLSNCLATKKPDIASEWHPTKNGDLTPYDVTVSSGKYAWWQCSKNPKHIWYVKINSRSSNNSNCPYCSGKYASEDYNLLVLYPELCLEWDYEKNKKKPEEYTPGSHEKVWWICRDCGNKWDASIYDRNRKDGKSSGCPECNKSKGEKKIDEILINKSWIKISQEEFDKLIDKDKYNKNYYIPQMKFKRLIGTGGGLLSYDFYIPKLNLLIEYDGEFHFRLIKLYKNEPIKNAEERYKKQCVHDILKNKYAMDNNIQLIRIPYWDFDNIEKYLDYYLKEEFLLAS